MGNVAGEINFDPYVLAKWYVFANRTEAVFYLDGRDRRFQFVERLQDERGCLQERELVSDRPGRAFSSTTMIRHGLEPENTRRETDARRFAQRIGDRLEAARREGRFNELVIAAEPHFLGLLRDALSKGTRDAIRHEVNHEYKYSSDADLRRRVLRAIEK